MEQSIAVWSVCILIAYCFHLLDELLRLWDRSENRAPSRLGFLLFAGGIAIVDIWSAAAMAALHLTVFYFGVDAVHFLVQCLFRKPPAPWQKLYDSGMLPALLLACLVLYGSINMNVTVQTNYIVTTHKELRDGGYRVAFLSDLHYGTVQNTSVLQSAIAKMNAQKPDIVVLGGDIVEEGTSLEEMQEVFYRLGCLEAPLGIYFVYGNHDRQADSSRRSYSDAQLVSAIESNGIVILEDEAQLIGEELLLIGRTDVAWEGDALRKEICELIRPGQEDLFLLTLDHQPLEAAENEMAGVDLMLSGHTHAGQLFPVGWLTEWIGRMNYGLYQTGSCQSIVSSGFAGWGYGLRTQGHCEYVIVDILPYV